MLLTRSARRATLLVHVLASIAWIGVDLVVGVMSFTGLTSDDPATIAMSYRALDTFVLVLLVPLGLASLATGLLLGLGTRYGIVRYWWVLAKLVISVVLIVLVLTLLRSVLDEAATASQAVDASLVDRLGRVRTDLIFPPLVSGTALVFAAYLAVFKPWGRTRWGRRAVSRNVKALTSRRPRG